MVLCPFWKIHVSGSILRSKSDARHLANRDVLFEIFQHLKTSRVRWQMVWVSAQNILDFSCKHVDSITCSALIHTACSSFHTPWDPKNHTDQRRSSAIFESLRPRRMIKTFCQWKHIPRNIIQLICTVPDIHSQLYARLYPHTCFAGQGRQCKWPSKQRAYSGHVNKCQGRHSTLEGANLIFAWSVCEEVTLWESQLVQRKNGCTCIILVKFVSRISDLIYVKAGGRYLLQWGYKQNYYNIEYGVSDRWMVRHCYVWSEGCELKSC